MDYLFLYDNPRARSNIVGKLILNHDKNIASFTFNKFKFADIKQKFKERGLGFERMRQKLTKFMGTVYWETMSDAEFD